MTEFSRQRVRPWRRCLGAVFLSFIAGEKMRRTGVLIFIACLMASTIRANVSHVTAASASVDPAWLNVSTLAASTTGLKQPSGIAVSLDGTVYTSDSGNHRITVISPSGTIRQTIGTGKPGWADGSASEAAFKNPTGIALDEDAGVLYVADTANHAIRRVTLDGQVSTVAGGDKSGDRDGIGREAAFNKPIGLTLGDDGTLYIADSGNHKIRALLPNGATVTIAGAGVPGYADGAAGKATFHTPEGIAVRGDTIYIADTMNHRIRAIRNGVVSTIAGSGQPGRLDGDALQASFHQPSGLALLEDGTLVVADRLNHQIRSVSITGMVGTLAGSGHPGYVDAENPAQAQFAFPEGIAARGFLVVGDTGNAAVRLVYPALDGVEIVPNGGPLAGGNEIRLEGTGFVPGRTSVRFGNLPADSVRFQSSTEILVTVPATTTPGSIDVTVETPAGTDVLQAAYTYFAPPAIASVEPRKGASAGGELVTVYGAELAPAATEVHFADQDATDVSVLSPSSLTAITPAHDAGPVDVKVTTPGGTATANDAFIYYAPPVIHSFTPAAGRIGSTVTISGANFDPEQSGNAVRFGDVSATVFSATPPELTVTVPQNATTAPLFVTTAGGTASSASSFHVRAYAQLSVTPASVTLDIGETAPLSATATLTDGTTETLTSGVGWTTSNASVASVDANGVVRAVAAGTATITATFETLTASASVTVETQQSLPPDPATIATPLDPTVAASFSDGIKFLYTSSTPVQREVSTGAIVDERAAVIRGTVTDRDLRPLSGVRVEVASAPQLGWTLTRADGAYDIAVNGGGAVTLAFSRSGYLPAQRQEKPRWSAYVVADPVALVPLDSAVTTIAAGAATMQVARGNTVSDSDGARTATILFPAGTTASMVLPDGTSSALGTWNVRATEYSVGPQGPSAMPAPLPPTSAYTYCVELSADEALAAGADRVQFSKPVIFYVDNFLAFPVGTTVPAGYYDRKRAVWVPSASGKVIKVLRVDGAQADVDLDGDGIAESAMTLEQNGITADERAQLATLYPAGQTIWRVTIDHFTPLDLNWPMTPADPSAEPPPYGTGLQTDINPDDVCTVGGSIIECQSQVLGESMPIVGTNLTLEYRSSRVPGRVAARHIDVVMTTDYVPTGVREVRLSITSGGKKIERTFTPSPNIKTSFTWDGRDAYGRTVQGTQAVDVKFTYVYPAEYISTDRFASYPEGVTLGPGRSELQWSKQQTVNLRPWDARSAGLGGWMLSEHRVFDRTGNVAYNGDGSKRSGDDVAGAITTIAGVGWCTSGCRYPNTFLPIPATQASIYSPQGVAVGPDGAIYVVANVGVLKLVGSGIIRIIGNGSNDPYGRGDGGPALQAGLYLPWGIALGPDGSIYVTEPQRARVRRVTPDGIITLFAGGNEQGYSGDGGPAVNAKLTRPTSITVASDGTVYVSETDYVSGFSVGRIRRITTDGRISTVAGGGTAALTDGVGATAVKLDSYTEIAATAGGVVYLAGKAVWRLDADGRIRSVAPSLCDAGAPGCNPVAIGMAAGIGGEVYVGEIYDVGQTYSSIYSVRRIDPDGTVTIVAQGPSGDPFRSSPPQHIYFSGEGAQATAAGYGNPRGLAIAQDGTLIISDTGNSRVRRVTTALGKPRGSELLVASANGDIGVFDTDGRHLRTVDPLTGALRASFAYDAGGQLASISDAVGNQTRIERNGDGTMAIVAPGGERTLLTVDSNGYVASVKNPAGETTQLASTAGGLLSGLTRPSGASYSFNYTTLGRLGTDSDPAGGSKNLSLSRDGDDYTLTLRSGLGRETKYKRETLVGGQLRKTFVSASGISSVTDVERSLRAVYTSPDGTVTTTEMSPDPRFGMELPFVSKATLRTPAGRTLTLSSTRSVTGLAANDPWTFTSVTQATTINSKTFTTTYDAAQRRITSRTPTGRMLTMDVDTLGRLTSLAEPGSGVFALTYGGRGEIVSLSHGARTMTFTYDDALRVTMAQDNVGRSAEFAYDDAGRLIMQTLPDGRTIAFGYDENGNLTTVTPPGRGAHTFAPTAVDLIASHAVAGTVTRYVYNADRQLTQVLRPEGDAVTIGYDAGGRIAGVSGAGAEIGYGYTASGSLQRASAASGAVEYFYDGQLLTREALTGEVGGVVDYTYNADLHLGSEAVGGTAVNFGYDADGFLTTAGALSLTRKPENGALASTTLAGVHDDYTYNELGEVTAYAASYNGSPLLSFDYSRDAVGRITAVGNTEYDYDATGRLVRVRIGGVAVSEYDYDANGNRIAHRWTGGSTTATYDDQDRLLTYGDATYGHTPSGDLMSTTLAGAVTTFDHDALGNLRSATLPGGMNIEYVVDGQNRRVGKKIDGTLVQGWLYSGQLRIVAELDGAGNVVSRFVYGTRTNVPDYLVKAGVTYRILSDHLGSPRLVVNTATGEIAQRIDYGEFGNVLSDTNPAFQPFGFAGGLYDADTRLVRFGARDYDPHTGRWTTKDPIGFAGGDTNLYGYVANDPVNFFDPNGLEHVQEPGFTRPLSEANWSDAPPIIRASFWIQGTLLFSALPRWAGDALALMRLWRRAPESAPNSCPYGSTPDGIPYTRHYGTETGPQRNIPGSVVDEVIRRVQGVAGRNNTTVYYDAENNVTVVLGERGVVSVHKGAP
jgi:RHS repeat-associated protein